jgi:hypothetical protein
VPPIIPASACCGGSCLDDSGVLVTVQSTAVRATRSERVLFDALVGGWVGRAPSSQGWCSTLRSPSLLEDSAAHPVP